ncbi:MAG: ABC transporter ATP-binding protein [Solirubrobacteraceae bacterium]|nr:ABC transporter ATP-binding protein [Solirubrobacteraceae bacterium]
MAEVAFDGVTKVFGDGTTAVDRLTLDVPDGEFLILVGPSGSGKSTALRMLAGLEEISAGQVRIGDRVVNDVPPKDRDIAMVFQSYALYPHMTVERNMGFALRMRGEPRATIADRVGAVARKLGIGDLLERRPRALSGGQRQRVALGRAIVRQPSAFLMDEPLSNLDAKLRVEMRAYIARLHAELGSTIVYVTHDQVEAMTMGDRVAVLRDGRLEQVGVPQVLYDRPDNLFVASFIGSPAMNLVRGRLVRGDGGAAVQLGSHRLRVPDRVLDARHGLDGRLGREVVVGIRPEAFERADGADPEEVLELPVLLTESMGSDLMVHAKLDTPPVITHAARETADEIGTADPALAPEHSGYSSVTARLAPDADAVAGRPVRLTVDVDRLHFFDPDTELAIR